MRRIRVAIVDDSSFVRKALVRLLRPERRVEVVGVASTGEELLDNVARWRPDVVTLDLDMPGIGGLATLDRLRIERPLPVVILSDQLEAARPFEAALPTNIEFIDKRRFSPMDFSHLRAQLVDKIMRLAGAPPAPSLDAEPPPPPPRHAHAHAHFRAPDAPGATLRPRPRHRSVEVLLIGASTGGPPAIEKILDRLGADVPVPILIVQHMPPGFTSPFAKRLNGRLPLTVREAADGEPVRAGVVHIAPAGSHMKLFRRRDTIVTVLDQEPANSTHRPSIDVLFHSACPLYGARAIAILLTGMGADGADGLAALARAGAHTIGQSEASCVVYGMPKVARALGAVVEELDLADIGPRVAKLLSDRHDRPERPDRSDGSDRQ